MGKKSFIIALTLFLAVVFLSGAIDLNQDFVVFSGAYIALMGLNLLLYFSFPKEMTGKLWFIFWTGVFMSRCFIFGIEASDDVNRYVWEGKVFLEGFNPYLLAPASEKLHTLAFSNQELWQGINHKDWTAIYPPFSLLIMTLGAWINPTILFAKAIFTLFDIGSIILLIVLLKRLKIPLRGIVLYAFNPLILYAFAGHGHLDSVQIFLTFLAINFYYQRRWNWMYVCLGLAVCSKYTSIIVLPFLINRQNYKAVIFFVLAFIVPFFAFGSFEGVFDSLSRFGTKMQFNDSLHALINYFTNDIALSSKIAYLCILLWYVYFYLTCDGPLRGGFIFTIVLLLFSPTVHYWYLSWLIPFIVFFPSYVWLILCTTIVFYFNVFGRVDFNKSSLDLLLEYVPFYIAGLIYFIGVTRFSQSKKSFHSSISVILPVYNESDNVDNIIASLQNQTQQPHEVIVVDAGSEDGTVEQFKKKSNFTILHSPEKGRGNQINYGFRQATGKIIFVMHADMTLEKVVLEKIASAMSRDDRLVGGCVGATFTKSNFKFRLIKFLNQLRVKSCGISFGDQGQFFYRKLALKEKWVQPIPLMEDVELAVRMYSKGKTTILDGGILVSTRRWDALHSWRNTWQVITLLAHYLVLRKYRNNIDMNKFYQRYYGKK